MKKKLIVVVIFGTLAAAAHGQSSVSLFGTIDLNGRYVKNDGSARRLSLGQGALSSSQLGFSGVEDLGGGLKASFQLLSGINADTGTTFAKFWNRRSTLSLSNALGEVRLGRDYTPMYWNTTLFDPFGNIGIGGSTQVARFSAGLAGSTAATSIRAIDNYVRTDNSIGYFLPSNLGGVYGQAMVSASEGGTNGANPGTVNALGRHLGVRVGYATGPINVATSIAQTRHQNPSEGKFSAFSIAGSYQLGFAKIVAEFNNERDQLPNPDVRERRYLVGAVVPIGLGYIRASYVRSNANNGPDASLLALGYVYDLSKRTGLYATVAAIRNDGNATTGGSFTLVGGSSITALPTPGGDSKGFEIGMRHFF